MTDRTELLEAALDSLPEGVAVLGQECHLFFWNRAAEAITGHTGLELVGRPAPELLNGLLKACAPAGDPDSESGVQRGRAFLAHARHTLGHEVPVMARTLVLRDGLGEQIGTAVVFHPAESLDALPHGEIGAGKVIETNQADLKDCLETEFEDYARGGLPFGVLWIAVDQGAGLRKTHGNGACEAMLEKVERALAHGLRPAEQIGRWGDEEFLVVSHERTPEMLAAHAQALAGLARTAEFRWWGDRVSLTVSIGAAQANRAETLAELLERAQQAMVTSVHAGGNHMTLAPGRHACLPS
ncbi:MAG: diguanylate cyclase [Terracidiphilus sp.]|jgi:diguanylate cyclase (GGDEF)-like protein/PAS domain S-box-containing protein